ncbi:MAG: sulfatase-like hydrolase/transferase, partial [Planctomycetes bacterium]|nr:sulfatase-like hydrolase/transferase [Planctomycetota bacterium]
MTLLRVIVIVIAALLTGCAAPQRTEPPSTRAPNVVIIFTDDQGYGDVGAYGSAIATPNLDRMAREGMRFTDFYVAQPVCSASRAALLTGCYPNRIGIAGALGPGAKHGIADDEVTLAEICRSRGYATAAFGKWHLGHRTPFLPVHHGFDEYYGVPYSNDMWPLHPDYVNFPAGTAKRKRGYPDLPTIEGDRIADPEVTPEDQKRFTSSFTERAVAFIDEHHDRPFFLYLAHPMPHVPLYTAPTFEGRSAEGRYGDVIEEIDWSVGRVLDALRRHGLDDRTLVLFASDNGPWLSYGDHAGTTGPLREGKGTTFEGG